MPVRIAVNGATGRMGQSLLRLLRDDGRFELVAAVTAADEPQVGQALDHDRPALRYQAGWPDAPVDVVVDFSGAGGVASALQYCQDHGVALVSGTTGLEPALQARVEEAAARIAVMQASNFSLGVAVLTRLLAGAASALPAWDLEIVEAHHARKVDAPSGTALSLAQAAADARGVRLDEVASRGDRSGAREPGGIGFAVVRGGDIVGEHSALLIGPGERLELGHRATDRAIFARGAIEAAYWLHCQPAGRYPLDALLAAHMD